MGQFLIQLDYFSKSTTNIKKKWRFGSSQERSVCKLGETDKGK